MKKISKLKITTKRIILTFCPLFSIACYSADEWPARVEMLDNTFLKNTFYQPALDWKSFVDKYNNYLNFSGKDNLSSVKTDIPDSKNVLINSYNADTKIPIKEEKTLNPKTIEISEVGKQKSYSLENDSKSSESANKESKIDNDHKTLSYSAPRFIITLGDSLMSEISQGLRQNLAKEIKIKDIHKSSTGLTNLDYYDWPDTAYQSVKQNQPDWVFIHLGGNDGQDMKIGKSWIHIEDSVWQKEYYDRANKLILDIKKANPDVNIVWIGLPAMRDNKFAKKIDIIRALQKKASQDNKIIYIDTNDQSGLGESYQKQGKLNGKTVVLRRTDGIHYSREGGIVMAQDIMSPHNLNWK